MLKSMSLCPKGVFWGYWMILVLVFFELKILEVA